MRRWIDDLSFHARVAITTVVILATIVTIACDGQGKSAELNPGRGLGLAKSADGKAVRC
jgi:hypothetical protein